MNLNVDKALVLANAFREYSFATPSWVAKNPLWFLALRDEDIPEIHSKIWGEQKEKLFAKYALQLSEIETTICDESYHDALISAESLVVSNEEARMKFYRYLISILFTNGLRTVDAVEHGLHSWKHEYFSGSRFRTLFELDIDTDVLREVVNTQPFDFYSTVDPFDGSTRYSRLVQLNSNIEKLIRDNAASSLRVSNPMKFVYGMGWTRDDRANASFYYNVI